MKGAEPDDIEAGMPISKRFESKQCRADHCACISTSRTQNCSASSRVVYSQTGFLPTGNEAARRFGESARHTGGRHGDAHTVRFPSPVRARQLEAQHAFRHVRPLASTQVSQLPQAVPAYLDKRHLDQKRAVDQLVWRAAKQRGGQESAAHNSSAGCKRISMYKACAAEKATTGTSEVFQSSPNVTEKLPMSRKSLDEHGDEFIVLERYGVRDERDANHEHHRDPF